MIRATAAMSTLSPRVLHRISFCLFVLTLLVFCYAITVNAWVVDDAYITFRTVDNFINGYGLRWNVDERVQVYTHPLWMFVISSLYLFTSDVFYTSIVVSLVFSIAAVWTASASLTRKFKTGLWKLPVFVIALVSSKAFIDFTSSGLETPLSYLIAALFFGRYMQVGTKDDRSRMRDPACLFFLASLAFVNRQDTVLLYLPALLHVTIEYSRRCSFRRLAFWMSIATTPAVLWLLFSLFYYGFPFPNTAYAKAICTGFPLYLKGARGLKYLLNSVYWDGPCHVMLAAAVVMSIVACWKDRSIEKAVPMGGVLLYLVYVVLSAASATHMSGRFFSVPFFIVIVVLVNRIEKPLYGLLMALALICYIASSPLSALKFGTSAYKQYPTKLDPSCIDTKRFVYEEGSALINWRPGKKMPDHSWYHYGENIREKPGKIHVGGAFGQEAIGYIGFAAGPGKLIVDKVAIGDPLLARLPAVLPRPASRWKSGHFHRRIPRGYLKTLETGRNEIEDERLALYYEKLSGITRGSLWSMGRLVEIVKFNLGFYDHLRFGLDYTAKVASKDIGEPRPEGTAWDHSENHLILPNRGLEIDMGSMCHASNIELSIDNYDTYLMVYLRGIWVVGRSEVEARPSRTGGGLSVNRVVVPAEAVLEGYDRIRISALSGDGFYSIGHLRLLESGAGVGSP